MIDKAYMLSRIYAKGWIAARAIPANDDAEDIRNRASELNPYENEPERSHWCAGFVSAQEKQTGIPHLKD